MPQITVSQVRSLIYRFALKAPVRTSFGVMRDRPAVLVEVTGEGGGIGWGEVWCNFPSVGAEHRARLVEEIIAPLIVGRSFSSPSEAFRHMSAALEVLAIQTGEYGPLAQSIAGVDIALWDLAAREAGQSLYSYLGGRGAESVPVYASGLNPDEPERLAAGKLAEGHRAFKLKVGFGAERDLRNLRELRQMLGDEVTLMIDANQGWDLETATAMCSKVAEFDLAWLEEPLRADAPEDNWRQLAKISLVPLAAGENIRGEDAFDTVIASGILQVIQPDLAKWGGFSACAPVARRILAAGRRFCPHWLGGGIGLIASLHLLAAAGGDGLLEVDSNPNPLRDLMTAPLPQIVGGRMAIPEGPGLGVIPDLKALEPYRVWP